MSDLDLELLRDWEPAPPPSAEVRERALARLEHQYTSVGRPRVARGFGRRFAIAAVAATVLVAGAIFAIQRAVDDRVGRIKTVAVPKDVLGGAEIPTAPLNILVVGSDARDGTNPEAFGTPEETGPPKSDTTFLLRIDGQSVRALWLPRDLMVGSPAVQLNSTFNDGPAGLITAVQQALGVTVDHYVEIDFRGLVRAVSEVGGVPVDTPGPVRDHFSGLDLPGPGCHTLDGNQALAWVRSRHLEVLRDGQWVDESPQADLTRIQRQQEFFRSFAARADARVDGDPVRAVRLVDALLPALTIDSRFEKAEILGLVRALIDVDPSTFVVGTVPVRDSGDGAHLVLDESGTDVVLAPFRGQLVPKTEAPVGPPPTMAPIPDC